MPQVKIHVSSTINEEIKEKLAIDIRRLIYEGLGLNDDRGQAIVYESEYRGIHYSRNREFISIEITIYKGTKDEDKKRLAKLIINKIQELTEIDKDEISLVYYEEPKENFFYGVDM